MIRIVLVSLLMSAVACGDSGTSDDDDMSSSASTSGISSGTGTPGQFVLDFTSSDNGGVAVGGNFNLGFAITNETPRNYAFMAAGVTQKKDGAIYSNDGSTCSDAESLEEAVTTLERLDSANVDVLSVDLKEVIGQPDLFGMMCYGFRKAGGGWTWELMGKGWTYSTETETYHIDIVLHEENVDAIKVASTAAPKALTKIVYSTF